MSYIKQEDIQLKVQATLTETFAPAVIKIVAINWAPYLFQMGCIMRWNQRETKTFVSPDAEGFYVLRFGKYEYSGTFIELKAIKVAFRKLLLGIE